MFNYEYWGNEIFDSRFNMAVEEYLLRRAANGKSAAVRFFSFPKDSVILGYAQSTDAIKKYDAFSDFDTKYDDMKISANQFFAKILTSKKFLHFKKTHHSIPFKFNLKTLTSTMPTMSMSSRREYLPVSIDKIRKIVSAKTNRFSIFTLARAIAPIPRLLLPLTNR